MMACVFGVLVSISGFTSIYLYFQAVEFFMFLNFGVE